MQEIVSIASVRDNECTKGGCKDSVIDPSSTLQHITVNMYMYSLYVKKMNRPFPLVSVSYVSVLSLCQN